MNKYFVLPLCLLIGASGYSSVSNAGADDRLNVASLARIAEVDPRFQSYNVEMAEIIGGKFWAPYPQPGETADVENTLPSGGLGLEARLFRQRPPVDLMGSPRLLNLARALGPAYIRVSGSWANAVFFQDDDHPPLAEPPKGFQNVLSREQWADVVAFAGAVDGRIVTSFPVSAGARDAEGNWDPAQARNLLHFTRDIGGEIYAAELINEPNLGAMSGLPPGYTAETFASDIEKLHELVESDAPGLVTVGPGSTGETGVPLFPGRGIATNDMLGADPRPKFDIFSYHFYGGRSERCSKMAPESAILPQDALGEEWLARTDQALEYYKSLRDRYMPHAPIWLTETAQASCGGDRWASSFLDTFRYVDQMGRLARQGVTAVFHNTLAASDYALVDEATLTPRPSYWTAVLWQRLMGEVVLDAGPHAPGLHVYAHCMRDKPGGVALVALNLDRDESTRISLPRESGVYALGASDLLNETITLNGTPLTMNGDKLPEISPQKLSAGTLELGPATVTFIAVPGAGNAACLLVDSR